METQTLVRTVTTVRPTRVSGYDVIGRGHMINRPMRIGDWWCVPLSQYESTIPIEGRRQIDLILKSERVVGFIVADDIRKEQKAEPAPQPTQEASVDWDQVSKVVWDVVKAILVVVGVLTLGIFVVALYALAYDPMLIAVLEDGRWVCLYAWYDDPSD